MFDRIRNHLYERRRGLYTAVGVAGSFYLTGQYAIDRLEEMREETLRDKNAQEHLRRHFQKNQEAIMFTIMSQLPTLSREILNGMDVESLTRELQARNRASRENPAQAPPGSVPRNLSPGPPPSESSLSSSLEFVREPAPNQTQVRSPLSGLSSELLAASPTSVSAGGEEAGASESGASAGGNLENSVASMLTTSSVGGQSWVEGFNSPLSMSATSSNANQSPISRASAPGQNQQSRVLSSAGRGPSDSAVSDSLRSHSPNTSEVERSRTSEISDQELSPLRSKTKAELWNEIKLLTFTRMLTIIYSASLLTLFTTMQFSIIGRVKYLQSIVQLSRDEEERERLASGALMMSILLGLDASPEESQREKPIITSDVEHKLLTLTWWLLYVGWKDVGERVRKSTEETLEEVSLKARLGPTDLHRIIQDIRRRVEHEYTYEGTERRINFLSTLIPATPETLALAFSEGGVPGFQSLRGSSSSCSVFGPHLSHPSAATLSHDSPFPRADPESDPLFASLLAELRDSVKSQAFEYILEIALDRATEVLIDDIRQSNFSGSGSMEEEIEKPQLAKLLPSLSRWAHTALEKVPNELVEGITGLKETTALASIIYSNFDDKMPRR